MRTPFLLICLSTQFAFSQSDTSLCKALYDEEKYEESFACYEKSAETVLDYYMCAMLARHLEKEKEFKSWSKDCLKKFKNEPKSYYYISYLQDENSDEYLKITEKGLKKFPMDTTLLTNQINFYIGKDNKKKALQIADELTVLKPDVLIYQVTRGTILQNMNREGEALIAFKKCLKIDPNNYTAHYGIGSIYYNWAADKLTKANESNNQEDYKILNDEGLVLLEKARPYLEQVYLADPKDETNFKALKTCYIRLEMMDHYRAMLDDQ